MRIRVSVNKGKGRMTPLLAIIAAVAIAAIAVVVIIINSQPSVGPYVPAGNTKEPQNHVINVTDSVSVGDKG